MYVLGLIVFGVHLFFNNPPTPADDAPFLTKLAANLIEWTNWESLPSVCSSHVFHHVGQPHAEHFYLGKVGTVALLFITFLPIVISLDNLISNIVNLFSSNDTTYNFIPIDNYNFFISGLLFLIVFWGFTYKYQRSFSYAVTTNAIIFQHAFLLSRSHRRILFDRISEVMVERRPWARCWATPPSPS